MKNIPIVLSLCLALVCLLPCTVTNAQPADSIFADEIVVSGDVFIWSLEEADGPGFYTAAQNHAAIPGGKYIPARRIYLQVEYDTITSDPETYTDEYGHYWTKKSGLVEGSTYHVDTEVRAKAILGTYGGPILFTDVTASVFNDSSDYYPVNGQTSNRNMRPGNAYELDVYIGGPQNNISEWWDDTYWDVEVDIWPPDASIEDFSEKDDGQGIHPVVSFWITQVLQDYFEELTDLSPRPQDIYHDTWIIYPSINEPTHYGAFAPPPGVGSIDIARERLFPGQFDNNPNGSIISENWYGLRRTVYHEYSHKVMHDVYTLMPKPNVDEINEWGQSKHTLTTCANQELAWTEGFAEFLPAAVLNWPTVNGSRSIGNLEYSTYPEELIDASGHLLQSGTRNDIGWNSISWHREVMRGCLDRRENEGEVAAVLWDIYDPVGWEYLYPRLAAAPSGWERDLMWYDRIADPYLTRIWSELKENAPDSINDEGDLRNDSFWTDWLDRYAGSSNLVHGLKAVLYNRGIDTTSKPEHQPRVEDFTIDAITRKGTVTISEPDPEDQPYLYYNVGYMKNTDDQGFNYYAAEDQLLSSLGTTWQNGRITLTFDIPRGKLGYMNEFLIHDSMEIHYRGAGVHPTEEHFNLSCANRQTLNFANAIVVQGNYAYVADMEDGLIIYDITNPLQPVKKSALRADMSLAETPWGGAMDVTLDGNYAYIAAYSGALVVVDVSNPANPLLKGYLALEGDPRAVAVSGKKAYVVKGTGGLDVVNIMYPYSPWVETSVGSGGAFDIFIHGDEAFIAADGGLEIFTLGDVPGLKGVISTPGDSVTGVAVDANGLIYLATRNGRLMIYDLSTWDPVYAALLPFMAENVDPERAFPIQLANIALQGMPGSIKLDGTRIYVGRGVYDVSIPELPYRMASNSALGSASDFAIKGDVVYVAAENGGLLTFSRSNLAEDNSGCGFGGGDNQESGLLKLAGVWQGHINDLALSGDYAFLATGSEGLKIVSVQDPGDMQTKTVYNQSKKGYELDARGVDVDAAGAHLYLSSMKGDLQILDITRPEQAFQLGTVEWNRHEDVGGWSEIQAAGNFVFVCAGLGGVRELDVRNQENPPWRGVASNALNDCTDVAVSLPFVYVLGFDSGLHIFELMGADSNSLPQMVEVFTWALPEGISGSNYSTLYLDETNKLLYISALWNGVTILDISNPYQPPSVVASFDPGRAYGLAGSGKYLFVGDDLVVHVVNVSDPANPQVVGEQELTDRYGMEIAATILKVHNNTLYVVTNQDTLQAYRLNP